MSSNIFLPQVTDRHFDSKQTKLEANDIFLEEDDWRRI